MGCKESNQTNKQIYPKLCYDKSVLYRDCTVYACDLFQLKRRSGRHTKRKKYMDELDLNLSDEDTVDAPEETSRGGVVKPAQVFVVCMGSRLTYFSLDIV